MKSNAFYSVLLKKERKKKQQNNNIKTKSQTEKQQHVSLSNMYDILLFVNITSNSADPDRTLFQGSFLCNAMQCMGGLKYND